MAQGWTSYTQILIHGAIKLMDAEDVLLWSKNPATRAFIAKLGYAYLFAVDVRLEKILLLANSTEAERNLEGLIILLDHIIKQDSYLGFSSKTVKNTLLLVYSM